MAFFGSIIIAGLHVGGPNKGPSYGPYGKYNWHVWTAIVMFLPVALMLVFLGCAWMVITIWQGLTWLVGLVGIDGGGGGGGGITGTKRTLVEA